MHISAKSDYALRALIVMAQSDADAPLRAEAMATTQDIPQNFLLAILADLRRAIIEARPRRRLALGEGRRHDRRCISLTTR